MNTNNYKELETINRTLNIIKKGGSLESILQKICLILPNCSEYPDFLSARIVFNKREYNTPNFLWTKYSLKQNFISNELMSGYIELHFLKNHPELEKGIESFSENQIIGNIANIISGHVVTENNKTNNKKHSRSSSKSYVPIVPHKKTIINKPELLHRFLYKQNSSRDIYHDLMPFKVGEILLIANLYDAFTIEEEGRFTETIFGEYYHLNLTTIPRITGVSGIQDAMIQLKQKNFDLVIIMTGIDKDTPIKYSHEIKKEIPYIPVYLLLNNNSELPIYEESSHKLLNIDKLFIWNGDSKIFFAMVKCLEDEVNIENDVEKGMVRIILLVEDSAKFYSQYFPLLYNIIMDQSRRMIRDVTNDELYKVLRMRARPKILHATTYEEAVTIYETYKENIACLISDIKFEKNNVLDSNAGLDLIKYVREQEKGLPIVLQSSEEFNETKAEELKTKFINKNSESLHQELVDFIHYYLGFGNFIFRDKSGEKFDSAKSIKELEEKLTTIPEESLEYHANRNNFSMWLMARGEIQIAKDVKSVTTNDFNSTNELRSYLCNLMAEFRKEKNKGKVINYEDNEILEATNILNLASGAMGGKGRGLAFINTLLHTYDISAIFPDINVRIPKTLIIGTDEFNAFLHNNDLHRKLYVNQDYKPVKELFLKAKLSDGLLQKLEQIVKLIEKPIAIRSSGLFEDSQMQPFAGIFETYLLPNNDNDIKIRLKQCTDAIKLVYASIFSKTARGYINAINYKIEEEKMAIVIQEVVGSQYDDIFYPHISGVAQSYNFYPFTHMKPEEGFCIAAVGLGSYVVNGEKAFRFSPVYPETEINSSKDQFKNSQTEFIAIDLNNKDINLLSGEDASLIRIPIDRAEKDGTLKHCASVFDADNDRIKAGIDSPGPRIVNFANILKYDYIPFAKTLKTTLNLFKEAMGSPVEIEFAVDLNKDDEGKASLYLLQVKSLLGSEKDFNIKDKEIENDNLLLLSRKCMGNGVVNNITDVIYVDTEIFDKSYTTEIAGEIEILNAKMIEEKRDYILIGPGRWGTRDPWIGIPVNWPQISNAKIIIETSLAGFPLEASSGSHFFHNVTSMNIGYFSIIQEKSDNFIHWNVLKKQKIIRKSKFVKHIRFDDPLTVKMDGKKGISIISWEKVK